MTANRVVDSGQGSALIVIHQSNKCRINSDISNSRSTFAVKVKRNSKNKMVNLTDGLPNCQLPMPSMSAMTPNVSNAIVSIANIVALVRYISNTLRSVLSHRISLALSVFSLTLITFDKKAVTRILHTFRFYRILVILFFVCQSLQESDGQTDIDFVVSLMA